MRAVVRDANEMSALAAALAPALRRPGIIFLRGELGAGKTHWTRALLRALGETAPVPSPTFPLAQTYHPPDGRVVHHLDFYRLSGGEWRESGMDELLDDSQSLRVVEWPERADHPPQPDLIVRINFAPNGGRQVEFSAESETGKQWLRALNEKWGIIAPCR